METDTIILTSYTTLGYLFISITHLMTPTRTNRKRIKMLRFGIFMLALCGICLGVELTFELEDKDKQCFYEELTKGTTSTVEFQVVTGGHYDVDMTVHTPKNDVLYQAVKKQYDSYTFKAEMDGAYSACFSNEFSTFSHKLVYVDWQAGEEQPLPGLGEHSTAMTQLETSSQAIHENMNTVIDYQTHHRLRESQGRKRAEDLNQRVFYWSVGETLAVLIIGIGQVWILKSFFDEKKPSQYT